MFWAFLIGGLVGGVAYLFDDDDGVVTYYGKVVHSWLIIPAIATVVATFLWAFEVIGGELVLWMLLGLLGWTITAYLMGVFWPAVAWFLDWIKP